MCFDQKLISKAEPSMNGFLTIVCVLSDQVDNGEPALPNIQGYPQNRRKN